MKVYGLKRATPGMKIQHMRMMIGWQAGLQERQAQYRSENLRVVESRLMDDLACLDPACEVWFDNDDNVPDYGPTRERIQILERRVAELKQAAVSCRRALVISRLPCSLISHTAQ